MPSFDETTSSPLGKSPSKENALEYYKSQYEQLEAELADFQASSRELEAELEKDVEASEKRERQLQEKVEGLGFEVDEWKVRFRLSYLSLDWLALKFKGSGKIQTVESRSKHSAEHAPEGDYYTSRY